MVKVDSPALLRRQIVLVAVLALFALAANSLPLQDLRLPMRHYLPFHTALELAAVLAAFLVFSTVWHTPARQVSNSLLVIAVALLASGWLDFAHAMSFHGMPDLVTPSSYSKSLYFWLAARGLVALTLFVISVYPSMAPSSVAMKYSVLLLYTAANVLVIGAVLAYEPALPVVFTEGLGVTNLKVVIEWCVTGLMLLAAARYFQLAWRSGDEMPTLMFGASAIAAIGEMFFMRYTDVNDAQNILGHVYKILGYWLIYRAVFVISIRKPYDLLEDQTRLLERANSRLRIQSMALESTTAPIVVTDKEGNFLWRNRASHVLLQDADSSESGGLSLFAAPATPDPVVAKSIREALFATGTWNGVVEFEDTRGNRVTVNRKVTCLRNEDGLIEGYVSVAENVTENRRARDRHKRVLDTAIDGFLIISVQGAVLEVNAAFERMSGYGAIELQSLNFHETKVGLIADVQAHLETAKRLGQDRFETHFENREGHDVCVVVSVTFDPEVQQYFVFVRDTTEQLKSEVIRGDLERQLQQAQKMETMGQLTGGIAHDFNNILVSVLGYSKLALDRLVPDKQSKLANYLREIIMASERARDLIAKMLVFTRTQASTNVAVVSPAAVVREVLAMVRPSIPASIDLDVHLEEGLYISMDAGELNQMLINLLINARDAIDGRGVIGVHVRRAETRGELCAVCQQRLTGAYLALEVTDTGSGIAPEHMARLFDPFFTTKDVGKGTGLGLSMVQGLLIRSGGHITVESQPGRGSSFQLLFPLVGPEDTPVKPLTELQELHRGAGQLVAVVDDEPAVTRYLGELLQGQGYRVRQFTSPVDLLAAFDTLGEELALVVTDQTMPGMNGTELAVSLHQKAPGLPVILCTGYAGGTNAVDVKHAGICHQFTKPVDPNVFLQTITDALQTRRI